ncbi:tetratricopeptide repeat protein [Chelativorans salis]|uniref:Sel1 repeat family protein n=1 Tax=Chelativorans salis TaxID=2978478 RepID=A0ABT2LRW2_9HYPH|nr:tetratricopeptide repeat protein [Chelativorans sp. EGI FJ00035]MCT7377271.1 sel1 repeat family protein [Chelativorans sp. EGI FJ00035]
MNEAAKSCLVILLLALAMGPQAAWAQEDGTTAAETQPRPGPQEPSSREVDPKRFGKVPDPAFGAYQRGHYLTALELARPRAEAGNSAAQTLMAEIYARGLGVARDAQEAAKWYAKAAEQGDPEAQMQYALMLIDGRFVKEDREKAYTLMRSAAEAGKPLAQFNLAQMMIEEGASMEEAVGWYERAARAGLPDAQYAMAQVHANGVGGKPEDAAAALRWLLRAARQNYDTAQLDLGTWLVEGRGGEAKPELGFAWLKRAAEGGNVAAQNRVAKLLRAGVGVEADPVQAAAWYILARRAGLTDSEMEDFLDGLTSEQLKDALERANRLR